MQKKLIALAIAGLSSAAFAQSNVTIYGVMDATYDNLSANGANVAGTNLPNRGRTTFNSSLIGFKGSEDLGGGLKAVFQVETGVGENSGAGGVGAFQSAALGWATRDTFVGMSGGFGTLVAGVLSGPTRVVGGKMDVNSGATGIGANSALLGKLGSVAAQNGAGQFDQRINNAIAYISPTWTGFHFAVGYLPNENRGTDASQTAGTAKSSATLTAAGITGAANCSNPSISGTLTSITATCPAVPGVTQANTSGLTLGAVYDLGPVFAALTWTELKDANANDAGSGALLGMKKASNTRLAGKYDFGMGTVGLMWDKTKADLAGNVSGDQTVWYLPVTFKAGANGKVIAQYGHAGNVGGNLGTGKDYTAKHFELGYVHNLSKRTEAKVLWSQITNGTDAKYDFLYGVSAPNTTTTSGGVSAGSDPRGLSVGIRHSF